MCLVACVSNDKRAVFLSDGLVLGPDDKPVQTNFSKLFPLPGGQILAAIGKQRGIEFAQSLQKETLDTEAVCNRIRAFTESNSVSNCFTLAGIVKGNVKVFQWSFDGTDWYLAKNRGNATGVATFVDGFFTNRDEVKAKLAIFDDIRDIDVAAIEMRKLFDEIKTEYPNKIGGTTFVGEVTLEHEQGLSYARVTSTAITGGNIDFSKSGFSNKNLDNVADGSSKFAATGSTLSYRPLSNPLTATDAGSTATINVAAFTQRIAGKGDISISGGTLSGKSYNTTYFVYYDDSTLAGGAVSYGASTTKEDALDGDARFFVGSITTPLAGSPDTVGNNDGGTGAQSGGQKTILFSTIATSNSGTGVSFTGALGNVNDGDFSNYFGMQLSGTNDSATLTLSLPPVADITFSQAVLCIETGVPTNDATNSSQIIVSYSLDSGVTWTDVYNITSTRARNVDAIVLSSPLNLSRIQVKAEIAYFGATHTTAELDFYEAWLLITN